jgi:REP element-mobilizing transposase RayT
MGLRGRANLTGEYLFFVTTTVVGFTKVFVKSTCCDILVNNIKHYQNKYKFEILTYVIMPTHLHWIIMINPEFGTVSDIMRDIKKYSAWDIMEIIEKEDKDLIKIFYYEGLKFTKHKRKFWMQRFDPACRHRDEIIRNEKMFWTKLHYIHRNPVEAGLVDRAEKYKYSSAGNYINNDHSILRVDTSYAGTEHL